MSSSTSINSILVKNLQNSLRTGNLDNTSTEIQIKSILTDIYNSLEETYLLTILPPYKTKLDVTIMPNEYSTLFAFNRCLSKLLANDIAIFNNIGIYPTLSVWNADKTYAKGDRVIVINTTNEDIIARGYKANIFVALVDGLTGIIPDKTNTIKFSNSLYDDPIDNKLWAEEIPLMDSFNISTGELSLDEYTRKPLTDLSSFNFTTSANVSTGVSSIIPVAKTTGTSLEWGSNPPIAYNSIEFNNVSSATNTNPNSLYIIDKSELIDNIQSNPGCNDYVISSVIVNDDSHKAWARIWKSGWIEQGGVDSIEIDLANITFANDTYLIGLNGSSNLCINHQLSPIFNENVEFFTTFTDVQDLKWKGYQVVSGETISSEYHLTAFVPFLPIPEEIDPSLNGEISVITVSCDIPGHEASQLSTLIQEGVSGYISAWTETSSYVMPDVTSVVETASEYIYNVQTVYMDEIENKLNNHITYQSPAVYFSGICTEVSSKNLVNVMDLLQKNEISASAKISWESQGILKS